MLEYILLDHGFPERGISERGNQGLSFCTIFLLLFDFIKLSTIDTSIQTTKVGSFISLTFLVKDFWFLFGESVLHNFEKVKL